MRGTLFVGCSGFSYAEWKPEFYPADLKTRDMLRDAGVLDAFLARLPGGDVFSFAMEFRHPSWDEDEPRRKLAEHGIAWCVADTDERDATVVRTSERFAYFRLRKNVYDDHQLQAWSKEIAALLEEGRDAFVYFKHEDEPTAPRYALRMRELAG